MLRVSVHDSTAYGSSLPKKLTEAKTVFQAKIRVEQKAASFTPCQRSVNEMRRPGKSATERPTNASTPTTIRKAERASPLIDAQIPMVMFVMVQHDRSTHFRIIWKRSQSTRRRCLNRLNSAQPRSIDPSARSSATRLVTLLCEAESEQKYTGRDRSAAESCKHHLNANTERSISSTEKCAAHSYGSRTSHSPSIRRKCSNLETAKINTWLPACHGGTSLAFPNFQLRSWTLENSGQIKAS